MCQTGTDVDFYRLVKQGNMPSCDESEISAFFETFQKIQRNKRVGSGQKTIPLSGQFLKHRCAGVLWHNSHVLVTS